MGTRPDQGSASRRVAPLAQAPAAAAGGTSAGASPLAARLAREIEGEVRFDARDVASCAYGENRSLTAWACTRV